MEIGRMAWHQATEVLSLRMGIDMKDFGGKISKMVMGC
tara:strand:+ start:413 stop:526 length:114 start_codon:yes stop_codon:yes gene_type:complete